MTAAVTDYSHRSICHLLSSRLALIELRLYGSNSKAEEIKAIPEKFKVLSNKVQGIEKEIQGLTTCYDLMKELKPLLNKRQGYVNSTLTTIHDLSTKRDQIKDWVDKLKQLKELSNVEINIEIITKLAELEPQVVELDQRIYQLALEIENQTNDIDKLLDSYDQTMAIISDKFVEWYDLLNRDEIVTKAS